VSPPPPPRPNRFLSQDNWSQEACECIRRQFGKRCCHDRSLHSERGKVARFSAGTPERRWQLPCPPSARRISFLELQKLAYEMQPAARKGPCNRPARAPVMMAPDLCAALVPGSAGPDAPLLSALTPTSRAQGG
jgi:hypothetical protein